MSSKAIFLLNAARRNGIQIILQEGSLQLKLSKGIAIDNQLLQEIKDNKESILDFLKNNKLKSTQSDGTENSIRRFDRNVIQRIPLSFSQERLWFINQLEGTIQYHIPAVLRLKGKLNKQALSYALQALVNRHESLRSVVFEEQERFYQKALDAKQWELIMIDNPEYYEDSEALKQYIHQIINEPFDLSVDFMLRAALITLEEQEHVLVVTMHHIASDGWSIPIVVKEVAALYGSYAEERPSDLAIPELQYADFAVWQRNYLQGAILENKIGYWKEKLKGVSTLQLPTDFLRPPVQSSRGAAEVFDIDKMLTNQLQLLCEKEGVTLFMTLLSAFKILLHKYSGQQDICVGIPIAGRLIEEVEKLIGFFVNTLALRTQVTDEMSFKALLAEVKETTIDAYEHQEAPFEKIVEAVVKERDLSRHPIFQVLFVLQNTPDVPVLRLGDVELSWEGYEQTTAQFELMFNLKESPVGIQGSVQYCTDIYSEHTIQRMIGHFIKLLQSIVQSPTQQIGKLSMLDKAEELRLLVDFNDTGAAYAKDSNVISLFEEQVSKKPESPALVFGETTLSYGELNERSNQLAHYLNSRGIGEETMVPICLEPGVAMITGILGILKAGATYVPVDPGYPQERIGYILEDTGADFMITSRNSRPVLEVSKDIEMIELDGDPSIFHGASTANLQKNISPQQLAYIIYTSGSTGTPKGVMIEHGALINYLLNHQTKYIENNHEGSGSFMHLSFTFDASVTGIFMPLLSGKRLVIGSQKSINAFEDTNLYKYAPYDFIKITPSHLELLQDKLYTSKGNLLTGKLVIGGEALRPGHFDQLIAQGLDIEIINEYGPTEATVGCSTYHFHLPVDKEKIKDSISIGKPIDNVTIYILGKDNGLLPIGVKGELCIGGDGLARGYLNRSELTAEKFIPNPFSEIAGSKLYKTGDVCRWLDKGNIAYLGRLDDQVKIRGYRVELGEIESTIMQSGMVSQSVVVCREDKHGQNQLAGYVVAAEDFFDHAALVNYLAERLPEYMIPSLLMELEVFPLTTNGKIDKRALPDPEAGELISKKYVAPSNEREVELVEIWQDLLEADQVGINDDFFEIGGHSLLAVRLVSAIRKQLLVELPVNEIFDYPTIALLATRLQKQDKGTLLPAIAVEPRPERIPLSFSQERLWFIHQLEGSLSYHLPVILRLKGKLNIDALSLSIQKIVERHEVLRTVLLEEDGHAYQYIQDAKQWGLIITNAALYSDEALQKFIRQVIDIPFDLSKDFMLRANLFSLNEGEHLLVATMHHIASDGWSMSIIVKELVELYNSFDEGRPATLPQLPVQYADYSIWQRTSLQGDALEKKLAYWKNKLQGIAPLQLPVDYPRQVLKSNAGARVGFQIGKTETDQLQLLSKQQDTTLFMTLLAAFKVLLHRYTSQGDICVGSPIANRTMQEVEELIGFFINTLALRTEVNENISFINLLQRVRATTLETYEHQDTPFEKVVDVVVKERDLGRSPIFQVMFVLQNTPEIPPMRLGEIQLSRESVTNAISKFDITLTISETPFGLQAALDYCTDLFKEATLLKMITHFKELISSIIQMPTEKIGSLPMLSKEDEHQLLVAFNSSEVAYPLDKTIVQLFEEQAVKHPTDIAVVFEEVQLTYAALNERSNQLANYLRNLGVKSETLVPLCVNRSAAMIVAILGILKAGGAYVPIDPDYPEERIAYMLKDCGATLIISDKDSSVKLKVQKNIALIDIDDDWLVIGKQSASNLQKEVAPHNLAYVIYTSGSTGNPKGVMIEHGALLDHCFGVIKSAGLTTCKSFALFAPIVFDAGHSIIHTSFILGSALHVLSKQLLNDGDQLAAYINDHSIDCIKIVPSLWLSYADSNNFLLAQKVMIFGGDSFSVSVLERLVKLNYKGTVYNHYGPTEATIGKTIHLVDLKKQYSIVPIGKPFSNSSVFIVNKLLNPVPVGVPGELFIAGKGLARKYLNNPALTNEKFIANPFDKSRSSKMYKTGDQARWLPDGNIEYLGRIDEQVKIRGFRIEPGEIENVLLESGLVQQAVVLAKQAGSGNNLLIAYIVPLGDFDKEITLANLRKKLPEYMIPSLWVPLSQIPLTSNGKVDKKSLPDPGINMVINNQYVAPQTTMEQVLANTWQELLGIEKVGIHDNFFDLGGDSIITIQVVSRARHAGYEFQVADIFTHQTIAKLAAVIEQRAADSSQITGEQGLLSGESGLLPIQQRYFSRKHATLNHFNQGVLLQIDKVVDERSLSLAVQQLSRQHDALRSRFFKKDSQWHQAYEVKEIELVIDDLSGQDAELIPALISRQSNQYQQSLDIEKGDLIRVVWLKTPPKETNNRLLIVVHHLVVDGVSWRILLEDIEFLLGGFMDGKEVTLGHKSSSYRQWFNALKKYGQDNRLFSQLGYWQKIIKSYHPLPVDNAFTGLVKAKERGFYTTRLGIDQTRNLIQDAPYLYHTSINDLLLSAMYITLRKWSGSNKIIIGLEGHGRQDIATGVDTSRTVGWFSTHYPLLLEQGADKTNLDDVIKSVKEQLRKVPDQGLGFGVLRYINKEQSFQVEEPWDIVFNYLGQLDNILLQNKWLTPAAESAGNLVSEDYLVSEKLSVNGFVQGGELQMNWGFSKKNYLDETISGLANDFIINLEAIIAHCTETKSGGVIYTPSDYGLGEAVSYEELDRFLDEPVKDKSRRESIEGLYRLSGLQQGLLFHSLYETGFGTYVHQFGCDLAGIDLAIFIQSWNLVISNHSILRTAFHHDAFAIPVQTVYSKVTLPVEILDLQHLPVEDKEAALNDYKNKDRYQSFDYKAAPLMRLAMIRMSEERFRMIWTWHHILFDGWSMPILMEEFLTTYETLVSGSAIAPVEVDRYEDYIRHIEGGDKEKEENYWRNYLRNVDENTLLPFIASTSERTKGAGEYKTLSISIDAKTTGEVHSFAQQNRITLNTVMQGVWACLLHQYTGNENVMYGVIVSGRPEDLQQVEKRVGLYINVIPLYTKVVNENNIIEWLQRLQTEQVSSRQCQHTPLSDIQRWTGIQGDLFDNLLVFDNYPVSKVVSSRQWSLKVEHTELHEQNNYPLSIVIISNPDQITIQFLYNASLIRETYMDGLSNHFRHVLTQIVSSEVNQIGNISFLTRSEEDQLLLQFNDAKTGSPNNQTFVNLFEEQVLKTPAAVALVYKETEMTYSQVNEYANRLAHYLQSKGVTENILVPVCIEKSFGMMIGILGILKAGGAYVPIDPDYPEERILYILQDTGAGLVLSSRAVSSKLQNAKGIDIIELREDLALFEQQPAGNLQTTIAPGSLAYVIYTSGSTGNSKGVMISHSNLVHYLQNNKTKYINKESVNAGSFIHLSYTFDASLTAMFMPLLAGKLVVIGSRQSAAVFEDPNLWKYAPYDFLKITPSHLEILQHTIQSENGQLLTNRLVIGGEALNVAHFNFLVDKKINLEIINEYGPTEATVGCTVYSFHTMEDVDKINSFVSIGKPIGNVQVYIVNKNNEMVPVGVTGEICISGDGVAKGYLNLPQLTAEKFIANPFSNVAGTLMYKSGDLGRWLPDGNIEFLGRIDDQVKVNGYRIELGEIESILSSMEGVRNVKMVLKESVSGNKKLNAYLQIDRDRLPLLNNYLTLLQKKMVNPAHLHILPNGLPVMSPNINEVRFLYKEIFEDHCYLKHGISLNEDSCVIDIGANVGFFTIFLNILNKNIKVYSVEPIPDVYNYLAANRKLYDIKGKAFQLAIADKEGEVDFTWYPQVSIVSGMSDELNKVNEVVRSYVENSKKENFDNEEIDSMLKAKLETRQIRCKTKTLSAIIEEEKIEKIDLLKVDVENSEHLVMNGILEKDWDIIGSVIIEVHDVNGRLHMIAQTLEQKGFTTYIEKEQMLSKDDVLYNLFAIKEGQSKQLVSMGNNDIRRSVEWIDPAAFIDNTQKELQQRLPSYMIPSNIFLLDEFPLTRNGKIDKNALPEVQENGVLADQFVAPRNELEEALAAIWMQVLEIDKVGIRDDFFALGGDSLLSIRLISSIRRKLDVELPISTFFELITVEKVAGFIKINQQDSTAAFEDFEEIKF